jgi:GNAT superfamily N-acetyltransferase
VQVLLKPPQNRTAKRIGSDSPRFVPAAPGNLRLLKRLLKAYHAFDHIPFREREITVGLRAFVRDRTLGRAWLIQVQDQIVGYVIVIFWFDLEFGGRTAAITDLYLVPSHRQKGLGRKTLEFVEKYCRQAGLDALELQVERRNLVARRFYKRNGFHPHDRVPMSKRFSAA